MDKICVVFYAPLVIVLIVQEVETVVVHWLELSQGSQAYKFRGCLHGLLWIAELSPVVDMIFVLEKDYQFLVLLEVSMVRASDVKRFKIILVLVSQKWLTWVKSKCIVSFWFLLRITSMVQTFIFKTDVVKLENEFFVRWVATFFLLLLLRGRLIWFGRQKPFLMQFWYLRTLFWG